jgi:DNA-binding transcriptional LysR family regulator
MICFNTDMENDGLLGVEFRHLRALLAIAETRSFSRAAIDLGYAQSAVSQQVATLERAVGHKLVERPGGPRPVSLTESGEVLARHAERLISRLRAAKADLDALASGDAGTVRIGVFQSVGARVLPTILKRFGDLWPQVHVELAEAHDDLVLAGSLVTGELDLTFVGSPVRDARFSYRPLLDDPYFLLAPPDSPIARAKTVRLAALDGADMVAFSAGTCDDRSRQAERRAGAATNIVFRSDDNLTVQRLVGAGLGYALMPDLAIERGEHAGEAVIVPLTKTDGFHRRIELAWVRDRVQTPASRAFVDLSAEVFAEAADARGAEPFLEDVAA